MDLYYIYYSCVASGTTCTAAGWGLISERGVASEELKEVKTIQTLRPEVKACVEQYLFTMLDLEIKKKYHPWLWIYL